MDYMKGYNSRNARRRSSYRRRRSSYKRRNSSYTRRRWSRVVSSSALKWIIPLAVFILGATAVFLFFSDSGSDGRDKLAASGAGVTVSSNAMASAAAVQAEAEPMASPTAEPGGVAETVASVGEVNADSIAKPTPFVRSKAVALTFDDGPSTVNTPKVLATLKKYNAHATFFVVGNRVSAGADLLKQEAELGCEIANHSWDHESLASMTISKVNWEYNKTAKLIKKLTGVEVTLLRPPYGAISDTMRNKLKHPMIFWSIDTLDWKSLDAKKVFKEVKKNVSDGDIILMHDIHAPTADAVKKIVPWLLKNDYDLLTVTELMERKGIKMKNGTVYASAR